jgi:hypothetical protein
MSSSVASLRPVLKRAGRKLWAVLKGIGRIIIEIP